MAELLYQGQAALWQEANQRTEGKNNYDKRHSLKEKQTKRDIARSMKEY